MKRAVCRKPFCFCSSVSPDVGYAVVVCVWVALVSHAVLVCVELVGVWHVDAVVHAVVDPVPISVIVGVANVPEGVLVVVSLGSHGQVWSLTTTRQLGGIFGSPPR